MLKIKLTVVGGEMEPQEMILRLPATIGRGRDVAVNLPHPLVSRRHCQLIEDQGRVVVRDLDSMNGTFVGSQRVQESLLASGDLLTVGTVTFRAHYNCRQPVESIADSETQRHATVKDTVRDAVRNRDSGNRDSGNRAAQIAEQDQASTLYYPAPPARRSESRADAGQTDHSAAEPPAGSQDSDPQDSFSAWPRRPK